MSKARGLADLGNAYSDGALSNRNLIINGAMQVAQRGVSQTTSGYGSVDRFLFSLSGGTGTMSQEELALGQTDIPSQFRNFLRVDATAGNNNMGFLHRIEDVAVVEGLVTISFYAKGANPASGSFSLSVYQEFGSGGSTGVLRSVDTFVTTSSWQRFEFTATVPSISGKTVGAGSNLEIFISQADADTGTSAWTLDITGVQLEVGDTATPFEHRSFGQELALCQRYARTYPIARLTMCPEGSNGDNTQTGIQFAPMRATPTSTNITVPSILVNGVATSYATFVVWPSSNTDAAVAAQGVTASYYGASVLLTTGSVFLDAEL
jgi:hypothetical protein